MRPPIGAETAPIRAAGSGSGSPGPAVLALGVLAFAAVSIEFLPVAALGPIGSELGVGEAQAGLLTASFAGALAVLTVPLALVGRRLPVRALLASAVVGLALTTAAGALASTLLPLVVLRILAGASLGMLWTAAGAWQATALPARLLARATAVTGIGVSLAFVAGLPILRAVTDAVGWRRAFALAGAVLVVIGAGTALLMRRATGAAAAASETGTGRTRVGPALGRAAAAIVVVFAAQYATFTYLDALRAEGTPLAGFLAVFGAAGLPALAVVVLAPQRPRLVLRIALAVLAGGLVLVAVGAPWPVTAAVWGLGFGACPGLLQAVALQAAAPAARLTAAIVASCFQVGIVLGSLAGGVALEAGPAVAPLIGVAAVAAAAVILPRPR